MMTGTKNANRLVEDLTVDSLTEHVIKICTINAPDERSKELISGLIQHVHDYIREVQMKVGEWEMGWKYLTEVRTSKAFHATAPRKASSNHDRKNLAWAALYF
jgi:hypothetical protein